MYIINEEIALLRRKLKVLDELEQRYLDSSEKGSGELYGYVLRLISTLSKELREKEAVFIEAHVQKDLATLLGEIK